MPLGTIGTIAAIAAAATSIGATAYSLASQPGAPNYNSLVNASAQGIQAQADVLPFQRRYQAAAQQGSWTTRWGYGTTTAGQWRQNMEAAARQGGPFAAQAAQIAQSLQNVPDNQQIFYNNSTGAIAPRSQAVVDFSGMGAAEVQSKLNQEMAQVQLQLQQRYGTQFAQEAAHEIALADPQGAQARQELYDLTEQQNNATPDRPVANLLDRQVGEQLASGSNLDPTMRSVLDQAVANAQGARGGQTPANTDDFAYPLQSGFEGLQRELAGEQKATGWLASGSTPEDIQYRRAQQNLANLGSFVNGQTPEAQFRNLSAASQGSTPFVSGQPLQQMPPDSGGAIGYTTAGYLQNMRYQQSQANPWMSGLSSMLGLGNVLGNAGWSPFAGSAPGGGGGGG